MGVDQIPSAVKFIFTRPLKIAPRTKKGVYLQGQPTQVTVKTNIMANYIVTFYDKKTNAVMHEVAVSYSGDVVSRMASVLGLSAIEKLRESGVKIPSSDKSYWSYRFA